MTSKYHPLNQRGAVWNIRPWSKEIYSSVSMPDQRTSENHRPKYRTGSAEQQLSASDASPSSIYFESIQLPSDEIPARLSMSTSVFSPLHSSVGTKKNRKTSSDRFDFKSVPYMAVSLTYSSSKELNCTPLITLSAAPLSVVWIKIKYICRMQSIARYAPWECQINRCATSIIVVTLLPHTVGWFLSNRHAFVLPCTTAICWLDRDTNWFQSQAAHAFYFASHPIHRLSDTWWPTRGFRFY